MTDDVNKEPQKVPAPDTDSQTVKDAVPAEVQTTPPPGEKSESEGQREVDRSA